MQSSENSIYVRNSAIRTVTVHLANMRRIYSTKLYFKRTNHIDYIENVNWTTVSGHSILSCWGITVFWTLVTCQRHSRLSFISPPSITWPFLHQQL